MQFAVDCDKLRKSVGNLGRMTWKLDIYSLEMLLPIVGLKLSANSLSMCGDSVKGISKRLSQQIESVRDMKKSLDEVIDYYTNTERHILGNASETEAINSHGEYYEIDSVAFDDDGSYGGNQGHLEQVYYWDMFKCWDVLADLRKYYPNMSIFTAFKYVSRLNHVGCGYVALANTLFAKFEGREDEFERIFGFPMYKDGDLNYDRLILDIYASTDIWGINDRSDGWPSGTTDSMRSEIITRYMEERGVTVTTKANVNITPDNVRYYLEDHDGIILGFRYGNLYNEDGSVAQYINGGHAIMVTGVTEDGRYIVSSWGKKYYIPASEINFTGDGADSFMTFDYAV